jgi:hypothetical protein
MPDPSPTLLIVETTAGEPPVEFLGDTAGVVYFISMAHGVRYGADHPLAKAASIIKTRMKIKLAPLLNFGDARADTSEEVELLERIWQDAGPLAEAARNTAAAIESTLELLELTSAFPELPHRLRELAEMADWAAGQGAQVRLTYVL